MGNQPKITLVPGSSISGFSDDDIIEFYCQVLVDGWQVDTTWGIMGGRLEVRVLTFRREDESRVTGTAVRMLPLGDVIAESRRLVSEYAATRILEPVDVDGEQVFGKQVTSEHVGLVEPFLATGPRGGKPLTIDDLRPVAEIYKAAYRDGRSVQRAVADAFHIAPSTATKRIMAARKAGLLEGIGPQ